MDKPETKKQYSIKLDIPLYKWISSEAKRQQRSTSNLIHVMLYDQKNLHQSKTKKK